MEKYIPLPKEFIKKGFIHIWVEDLDKTWKIYKRARENSKCYFYELVEPYKQEEYIIADNIISAKIKYPSDEDFGTCGFTFSTLEECHKKYEKIKGSKEIQKTKDS